MHVCVCVCFSERLCPIGQMAVGQGKKRIDKG